jgi:hypothetical protein
MDAMIDKWMKELESKQPALTSLMKMKHGLYLAPGVNLTSSSSSSLSLAGRSLLHETLFRPKFEPLTFGLIFTPKKQTNVYLIIYFQVFGTKMSRKPILIYLHLTILIRKFWPK